MRAFIVQEIANGFLVTDCEFDHLVDPESVTASRFEGDVETRLRYWLDSIAEDNEELAGGEGE